MEEIYNFFPPSFTADSTSACFLAACLLSGLQGKQAS
jgi:hypothetical protein